MATVATTRVVLVPDLAAAVTAVAPRLGEVRLVCVDGPAGSGKSTLSDRVAAHLAAAGAAVAVLRMDDLYRGWETDFAEVHGRLEQQVLQPLAHGSPGRYRRYDWAAERFAQEVAVPVPEVLVLDGVGSGPRRFAPLTSLLVWVEATPAVRLDRGVRRDGERLLPRWQAWMQHEAREFQREDTRRRAHVHVDGAGSAAAADRLVVSRWAVPVR